MAPNVFSRVRSASAFKLQIKRQPMKMVLVLEEHFQGQKCKTNKLLLIVPQWDAHAGLQAIHLLHREKVEGKKIPGDSGRPLEKLVGFLFSSPHISLAAFFKCLMVLILVMQLKQLTYSLYLVSSAFVWEFKSYLVRTEVLHSFIFTVYVFKTFLQNPPRETLGRLFKFFPELQFSLYKMGFSVSRK